MALRSPRTIVSLHSSASFRIASVLIEGVIRITAHYICNIFILRHRVSNKAGSEVLLWTRLPLLFCVFVSVKSRRKNYEH